MFQKIIIYKWMIKKYICKNILLHLYVIWILLDLIFYWYKNKLFGYKIYKISKMYSGDLHAHTWQ